ncbi:hypothetical protein BS17DRAFT_766280 [Gyrodon lividus]|nr:hypothetical protein BS17DRAFT_766280 [Gyrodon lividus]
MPLCGVHRPVVAKATALCTPGKPTNAPEAKGSTKKTTKSDKRLGSWCHSVTWKGTFGFNKGVEKDPTPTGKGKSIIQHCADIAKVLFSIGKKNSCLKATYAEYCNKLSETGHGLITGGCKDELHAGSDIANMYDDIQLKFLWYLCMHALMGMSPIASQKAISNNCLLHSYTYGG